MQGGAWWEQMEVEVDRCGCVEEVVVVDGEEEERGIKIRRKCEPNCNINMDVGHTLNARGTYSS